MKFKRGINVLVRFEQEITVPEDEVWSVFILGGYMETEERVNFPKNSSYDRGTIGKYTLPGGLKLKASEKKDSSAYGGGGTNSLLVGIALTAD